MHTSGTTWYWKFPHLKQTALLSRRKYSRAWISEYFSVFSKSFDVTVAWLYQYVSITKGPGKALL